MCHGAVEREPGVPLRMSTAAETVMESISESRPLLPENVSAIHEIFWSLRWKFNFVHADLRVTSEMDAEAMTDSASWGLTHSVTHTQHPLLFRDHSNRIVLMKSILVRCVILW